MKRHLNIVVQKVAIMVIFIAMSLNANAQFTRGVNYKVETSAVFSSGDYSPFWLTSNRYGLSSNKCNNGYLRAGIFRPLESDKKFTYSLGLDLAVGYGLTSTFVVQQAFAEVQWAFINLSVGSKERATELKNQELSTGGLTFSNNFRPVPQVRISIPDYVDIPGTKGFFALKGHVAYGIFTDDNWQKSYVSSNAIRTTHVLYHSKALYGRFGNESKFPLVANAGLEMAAQFGGTTYRGDAVVYKMPHSIKDFFRVFIPSGGGSNTPVGEQTNIYGNHLGSWNFSLSYKFPTWKLRGYFEHYFEDHSQMFSQYGWKDGLAGAEITLPQNQFVNTVVYEYMGSRDQTGPIYHDATEMIPDQISGADSYYNHGIYNAWQHWGMAIGNPVILSPVYSENGTIRFKSNRVKMHHVAISGTPTDQWKYRVMCTYVKNWGTYGAPFAETRDMISGLAECSYMPRKLEGWKFSASLAFDGGGMVGHNYGGMVSISKTGELFKK